MLSLPLTLEFRASISLSTPIGSGSIEIFGPIDRDKDGDPEVQLCVDLPGEKFDFRHSAEIPLKTLISGSVPAIASAILGAVGDVPGADIVGDLLDRITD